MNKKNLFKFILDLGMAVVLVLMYNKRSFNMSFHELGGLILIGVMLIHVLLNYKWVITITKRLFDKNIPAKTKIGYAVNTVLLISFLLIGISGIMISKTLFHLNIRSGSWQTVHYTASAIALIFIGVHIGLHKHFICGILRKLLPLPKQIGRRTGIILTSVIVVFGCYSLITTSFTRWLILPFTSSEMKGGPKHENMQGLPDRLPPDGTMPRDGSLPQEGSMPQDEQTLQKDQNVTTLSDDAEKPDSEFDREKQPPYEEGKDFGNGPGRGDFPDGKVESSNMNSIFLTIAQFFSIAYVFAVITVLLELLIKRRRKVSRINTDISQ